MTEVSIKLGAHEIVEYVDEALSWLAIASASTDIAFIKNDLHRASLVSKLDKDVWAEIECDTVHAFEKADYYKEPTTAIPGVTDEHLFQRKMISEIRQYERPCMAGIVMHSENVFVPGSSGDKMSPGLVDAAMDLESIALTPEKEARPIKSRLSIPDRFDLYIHQIIVALPDGRASGMVNFYCHDGKRFLDKNRMPLTLSGEEIHPWDRHITNLLAEQLGRLSRWTIELSLTESRTGVGLQTDAIGAREFIKAAAACTGTRNEKRGPLVHWVSEHMRASRNPDLDPHLVRAHLRGRQTVACGDYVARIYPSAIDCKRACNGARFVPEYAKQR